MKNLFEAINDLELAFAELGIKAPTIVLRNRGEMGALLFELNEGKHKLRAADKKKMKHCVDGLEFMVGEIVVWADYDVESKPPNLLHIVKGTDDVAP